MGIVDRIKLAGALAGDVIDAGLGAVDPVRATERKRARRVLASYDVAKPSRTRRVTRDNSTAERHIKRDGATLRAMARSLERNHDLARGVLNVMVRNIVGPHGIGIEPTPRNMEDEIDQELAKDLLNLWRDFERRPEVTHTMGWAQAQQLACRSWLRDGEVLGQFVEGTRPDLDHGTRVPFSIELMEADMLPMNYERSTPNIQAGIERNAWNRPLAYWLHRNHPGGASASLTDTDLKRVVADRILHLAMRDRISTLRGVSIFASVLARLDDVKEYEDSERIAARIAGNVALWVRRGTGDAYNPPGVDPETGLPLDSAERELSLQSGAILDDLNPGESLELLDPTRPNPNLATFRDGQLRGAAAGLDVSYSSLARDYNGTYSAQRQELVEQDSAYALMSGVFTAGFVQPIWERHVKMAIASGLLKVPKHIRPETIAQAMFHRPAMPWIDPVKEATANRMLVRSGFTSATKVISQRGGRMVDVYEEKAREERLAEKLGLTLESDAGNTASLGSTANPDGSAPDEETTTDAPAGGAPESKLNGREVH